MSNIIKEKAQLLKCSKAVFEIKESKYGDDLSAEPMDRVKHACAEDDVAGALAIRGFSEYLDKENMRFVCNVDETVKSAQRIISEHLRSFYKTNCGLKKPDASHTYKWLRNNIYADGELADGMFYLYKYLIKNYHANAFRWSLSKEDADNVLRILELMRKKHGE